MMENQRLLLAAALMFVVFLLWQNWLEFQAKKHPPLIPPVATAPGSVAYPAAAVPGQDVPTAPPAVGAGPADDATVRPSSGGDPPPRG